MGYQHKAGYQGREYQRRDIKIRGDIKHGNILTEYKNGISISRGYQAWDMAKEYATMNTKKLLSSLFCVFIQRHKMRKYKENIPLKHFCLVDIDKGTNNKECIETKTEIKRTTERACHSGQKNKLLCTYTNA